MNKKNAIILGSGTYGEVFLTYLKEAGFNIIGFYDDNPKNIGKTIHNIKVLGTFLDLLSNESRDQIDQIFCSIGQNEIRTYYLEKLSDYGYETPNFIHSSVLLNDDVSIGKGVYVLPGVIIMPHVKIEDFVIISMGSRIAHHTLLKKGVFISTGVNVGASIIIHEKVFLGISSTIMTGIKEIGENSIIGCGAVVIRDVAKNVVVAGVPAKKLKDLVVEENKNFIPTKKSNAKTNICNFKFEVIKDKKKWTSIIKEIGVYDFYHTYDYHMLSKRENETPILLKYIENDVIIALPLLIRKIKGTKYKDATSVYGYAGPISKGVDHNFNNKKFQKTLSDYFILNQYVSIFSRLNPFIPEQRKVLTDIGLITHQGKVVYIDLKQDIDLQRQKFQNRLKTHINKARRSCSIKKATTKEDIQEFIDIYYENMDRVNAKKSYYFSEEYFQKMVDSNDFKSEVLLAIDNESGQTIAASQYIMTNDIVQYHLSGTKDDFLHLMPTKLLIDEMRMIASEKGYVYFNLGGGLGGRDNDSLFNFKSSFSKDFKNFNLWKYICNQKIYDELVLKKGILDESDYFPLYRSLDDLNVKFEKP